MHRRARNFGRLFTDELIHCLVNISEDAPGIEEKIDMLCDFRKWENPESNRDLDRAIISGMCEVKKEILLKDKEIISKTKIIGELRQAAADLKKIIDKLTAPPFLEARYLRKEKVGEEFRATISDGSLIKSLGLAEGLGEEFWDGLLPGMKVYLSHERNVILGKPADSLVLGETGEFIRKADGRDKRIVVKYQGGELVLNAEFLNQEQGLKKGDQVLFDTNTLWAFEKLKGNQEWNNYFLTAIDDISRDQVAGAGNDESLAEIDETIKNICDPEAEKYGVDIQNTVLLFGRPGMGKTYKSKYLASEIQKRTGLRCAVMYWSVGISENFLVGETERDIRDRFRAVNYYSAQPGYGPTIMVIPEIDSLGRTRGGTTSRHSDDALCCFLEELDGFRKNNPLILIATCNRPELLDSALRDRFDCEIYNPPPNLETAREMFEIHLPEGLPLGVKGGPGRPPPGNHRKRDFDHLFTR